MRASRIPVALRAQLVILALMSGFRHSHALTQEYCATQNTGSDENTDIYQSNGACYDQCIDNYAFAIVQYQSCWCSNYAPSSSSQVDTSECSEDCPGYPDDKCGDKDEGLYGYIALTKSPSGTAAASSSSASSTSSQQSSSTQSSASTTTSSSPSPSSSSSTAPSSTTASSASSPSADTVYSSIPITIYTTVSQSPSVIVSYVTATSSTQSSTASTTFSSSTSTPSSSSSSTAFLAATTNAAATSQSMTHTTVVSTQVITISGAPVTQTVTSTPLVVDASAAADSQKTHRTDVSSGTIAGAVVGSVLGFALLAGILFFFWRKRRNSSTDPESTQRGIDRNISVLSKTGLLATGGGAAHENEKGSDARSAFLGASTSKRHSAMYTSSENGGMSPVSPAGGASYDAQGLERRNSRPLVFDQRLNPAAIMQHWESNGSRASIGTMQDQQDYSRPLNVTNPDPIDD